MSGEGEKLRECPFCGGADIQVLYIRDGRALGCAGCGARVHAYNPNAEERAREKWNTRASGWQPIETAPKDGTPFIGAFFSIRWADSHRKNDIVRCWWQPEFEAFISSCREMVMAEGYTINGKSRELHSPAIEPVTHWMPLPPTPQGEG